MSNQLKKHDFSIQVPRLFTRGEQDAYDLIHFQQAPDWSSEQKLEMSCPDHWTVEAANHFKLISSPSDIRTSLKAIEENTVPSWLWCQNRSPLTAHSEDSVKHVFDRIVGAAAYNGWKCGMFSHERFARNFYDEARYALAQRFIFLDTVALQTFGVEWAYGSKTRASLTGKSPAIVEINNTVIDAVVGGRRDKSAHNKWQKVTASRNTATSLQFNFTDTVAEWGVATSTPIHAVIDIMACRHNDGSVNIDTLRHLTQLIVYLVDLNAPNAHEIAIDFVNIAPLLTALALPYDSASGRATVAALYAIMTAEAYTASTEMAALRGAGEFFIAQREPLMRRLRNHRRSAYGERNDYEKLSVLPVPLLLQDCQDLALVAAARTAWDHAIECVTHFGLRHIHVSGSFCQPDLQLLMGCETVSIQPLHSLLSSQTAPEEIPTRSAHPALAEGLSRLGYDQSQIKSILRHVTGSLTLDRAPAINHAALKARGFDAKTIAKLEDYIPQARHLRFVFTPWILGEDFCRKKLKMSIEDLEKPFFDLLSHLGFKSSEIEAANTYCYGHTHINDVKELRPQHHKIFATFERISPESVIDMAAAAQSFVTGSLTVDLTLSSHSATETLEKLFLKAWRQGIKSLSISYDEMAPSPAVHSEHNLGLKTRKTPRRLKPSAFVHAKTPTLPTRKSRERSGLANVGVSTRGKNSRRNWSH